MNQSAPWQNHDFQNPQGGNVQFYDPNKFQATSSSQVANNIDHSTNAQYTQAGTNNSWNSWSNDWSTTQTNDTGYTSMLSGGQHPIADQAHGEMNKDGMPEPGVIAPDQQQQYYNQWNQQSWDPNVQQGWDPSVQQQFPQQQAGQYWENQQWQQQGQHWQNNFQGQAQIEHLQGHQQHVVQTHNQQFSGNTAGQNYDPVSPDTSGNYSQSSSFLSQSVGLNDSTSSSVDQSSSSQQLDPSGSSQSDSSALVADDSINSDGGTVSGFFVRDDTDVVLHSNKDAVENSLGPQQYLNVNPNFNRTESAVSNASLQTVNFSSQGSVGSFDDLETKQSVEDVTQQIQNVALNKTNVQSYPASSADYRVQNQNQNSGGQPAVPQEEEEQQTSNMNDWEIVPDQPQHGVNFFLGGNQVNQNESYANVSPNAGGPPASSSGGPMQGSAALPNTVPSLPQPQPTAEPPQNLAPPPPAGSSGADNPFRKASPHGVQRNVSSHSLSSLPSDSVGTGSPVIFNPTSESNVHLNQQETHSSVPGAHHIPRSVPSSVESDTSAFTSAVPTSISDIDSKGQSLQVKSVISPLPDKPNPQIPVSSQSDSSIQSGKNSGSKSQDSSSVPSSPRKHTSAFQPFSHRAKHSMSPATTLWDNVDAPATNIILAPAAPLVGTSAGSTAGSDSKASKMPVIPVQASLESKLKEVSRDESSQQGKDKKPETSEKGRSERDIRRKAERTKQPENERPGPEEDRRKREDDNRSINSLEELDADYRDSDPYRDKRYRDRYTYHDYRDPRYGYGPSSRTDTYKEDDRRRDPYRRDLYKEYGKDGYYDERYDRPRSRQEDDRPKSRSGNEPERPKSRSDYDRDPYYRERDRYRASGYDYDYYAPRSRYYDDRYYRYYNNRGGRYSRGYYEEMGYYGQGYDPRYSEYYGSTYGGQTDVDYDRYSQHSQSRGHTPAIDDNSISGEYYQGNGSRPSSRQGQEDIRSYARHGYDYDYGYDNYGYHGYDYDPNYGYYYEGYAQEPTGRMTPQKHTIPHVRASFGGNGQLIKVMPNRPGDGQPATVEVHSLEEMLPDTSEATELKAFPGPLTKVDTHKNDVLQFCQQQAQKCSENISLVDRESAELIWRLLELLIKQNGSVVGTDIADLLLQGHQPTSLEYSMMGMKISQSTEDLDKAGDDEATGTKVTSDRSQINRGRSLEEVTDRFRNLLLYGRKKDALEWATKNNLWGHALFLASKMDTRTHANVMIRFANSAMKMNDPLQTLYQLMSGRQPAAVTCVVDERWGDWRPHLAMILSNSSSKPDLDRKAIATLGDTMAAKGCLHASHFCYIMAQSGFGTYTKKPSKIVLIGSSHNLPWDEFATSDAIQCTEVYEYAQSLSNPAFILPHFQVYKFLYATRLAEYGFLQEALHYCEVIAQCVQSSPAWFQPAFVKVLYEFSNRVKFHDPQRLHSEDDNTDPAWLQQLYRICTGYDDGSIQPVSGSTTPAMFGGTTTSSENGDYNAGAQTESAGGQYQNYGQDQTQYSQEANQQYSQEVNQQYSQEAYQQYSQEAAADGQYVQQYTQDQTGYQQVAGQYSQYGDAQQQTATQAQQNQYQAQQWQNQQGYNYNQNTAHQQADQQSSYGHQYGYNQDYTASDRLASQRSSIASTHSIDTEGDQTDGALEHAPASTFDYFGQATTASKIVAPPSRYRTTSGSSSTGGSISRQRTLSGSSTGSVKAAHTMKKSNTSSSVAKKEKTDPFKKPESKGWFGSWFGSKKKKNEMHLPKDDKQSIVWDPVNKKWKNTDGDEEETKPALPPPKDSDLMGLSARAMPPASSAAPPESSSPTTGNKFSRPKGRGARNQYVDVLSSKTTPAASVPSNLFNVLPSAVPAAAPASTQIFNPSGAPGPTAQSEPSTNGEGTSKLLEPPSGEASSYYLYDIQDYNLAEDDGQQMSRSSSMSSLSREVQQLTSQVESTPAPVSNPVLFNPADFQSQQAHTQQPVSNRPKYGQRRQYPK